MLLSGSFHVTKRVTFLNRILVESVRLRLRKMGVLMYYVENKELFQT